MKTSVSDLREEFRHLHGDPVYTNCPPTRWKVYAEWLEQKMVKQSKDSLEDYPSEEDKKRKTKELVLFAAKIHYANKLVLKYAPSYISKDKILRRLDQAENITQLRKEYKQLISEFKPINFTKETPVPENVEVPNIEILKKQFPSICYSCEKSRKLAADTNIAKGYVGCCLKVLAKGMYRNRRRMG
jgi:hypothetical protein